MAEDGEHGAAEPFDQAAWFERLLDLNPWAAPFMLLKRSEMPASPGPHASGRRFTAARQTACLERHASGAESWNAWSAEMLKLKKVYTLAKRSRVDVSDIEGAWFSISVSDFEKARFNNVESFSSYSFPGPADFENAAFLGQVHFEKANFSNQVNFRNATFSDWANFKESTFLAQAIFNQSSFSDRAIFLLATFSRQALFVDTNFEGTTSFRRVVFSQATEFGAASFRGTADFALSNFNGPARFEQAHFCGSAGFENTSFTRLTEFRRAVFSNATAFTNARFGAGASFEAAQGKEGSSFSLADATFERVPDFVQAQFQKAPRLDNMRVAGGERGADVAARWRALRGLAIDGHDHERERDFFAGEILSQRWASDKPFPWFWTDEDGKRRLSWPNGPRFWFGLAYQLVSDFGRSTLRPVASWALSILVFAALYLSAHHAATQPEPDDKPLWRKAYAGELQCIAGDRDPLAEAMHLSLEKAFVFGGLSDANRSFQIRACLFGLTRVTQPHSGLRSFAMPNTPSAIAALGALQAALSATLIFFFLMAVRNAFRIK